MKTKLTLLVALFVLSFSGIQAQEYNTAVGLRLGYPTALTGKKFISDRNAIEAIVGFRSFSGFSYIGITGLYQVYNPIQSVEGLSWFYGGGANVYLYSFKSSFVGDSGSNLSLGLAGIIGLDYKFKDIPLNLSLDWLPIFSLTGYGNGFGADSYALSARYVLN
ncbi:MAG: hypothetical protein IPM42_11535 [Saprospiraceae bacterium]|nr:hypothetical protein [Saprospiraceae bacterium]